MLQCVDGFRGRMPVQRAARCGCRLCNSLCNTNNSWQTDALQACILMRQPCCLTRIQLPHISLSEAHAVHASSSSSSSQDDTISIRQCTGSRTCTAATGMQQHQVARGKLPQQHACVRACAHRYSGCCGPSSLNARSSGLLKSPMQGRSITPTCTAGARRLTQGFAQGFAQECAHMTTHPGRSRKDNHSRHTRAHQPHRCRCLPAHATLLLTWPKM